MLDTINLQEIRISQICPGCGRSLPFTLERFAFCIRCGRIFCREKCMKKCFCGNERCYICMENISRSGLFCEKH